MSTSTSNLNLISRLFRAVLAIALCWFALVTIAEIVADRLCGMRLDGDWFLLIAASSAEEMDEFCRLYSTQLTLGISAVVALFVLVIGFCAFARGWWWRGFLIACALYVGWHSRTPSRFIHWDPVYVAFDTVRSSGEYAEMIQAGRWEEREEVEGGRLKVEERLEKNLIVVIGESATADRMSLYGYAKPTTPRLDALRDQLTIMGPVRPNFDTTTRSLRMMLTRASAANPKRAIETAAVAFRRRGYYPIFIGAQPKWGRFCSVDHMLFAACESIVYLDGGNGRAPDEEVVPMLKRELSFVDEGRPFIAFIQLSGSHFDPKYRVPLGFRTPDGFDDYDRSIYYTDSVLGAIIDLLPENTVFVYTSDHGESPDSDHWRDRSNPSLWRVPFVVYPKDDSLPEIKTLDQTFELLMSLAPTPPTYT